jgi:transposase
MIQLSRACLEGGMVDGPRVVRPDRSQLYWDMIDLESQIPADHLVRVVWSFVERLDLSALYDAIRARDDVAGRPTADPKVLLALWLYATAEGIGSARALERLCRSHAAYRWLLGGVPVNYHGLSDFRTAHGALLDRVLTESVASLMAAGLIELEEVAVDGTKVQANAARGSFRGEGGLARFEAAARERVARLKAEVAGDSAASERRRRAAARRAAEAVTARAEAARRKLAELQAEKARRAKTHGREEAGKAEPQASTTDPEARVMRMADGGFRPAYNLFVSATPKSQVVLGVTVTDRRNDTGMAQPMVDAILARYGRAPSRLLIDTKAATADDIVALAARPEAPVVVYSPPPPNQKTASLASVRRREKCRAKEPPALVAWRARMASAEGQTVYARRGAIETVNGNLKNHGLRRFFLRGLAKTTCEALLHAIAHNLRRAIALGHVWA